MMRELDTVSPVVWPAWCYSGEGQADGETAAQGSEQAAGAKARGKRRDAALNGDHAASPNSMNNNNSNNNNNNNSGGSSSSNSSSASAVKTERLSPTTTTATPSVPTAPAATPDNNSSSSRSATPSSSYPGTPPAAAERPTSPAASPAPTAPHIKHMEQMMNRNYSDFMRSLAAKYNNSNPNDYFNTAGRNGYPVGLDPRFTPFKGAATPFVSLMGPLATPPIPAALQKNGATSTSSAGSATTSSTSATTSTPKDAAPTDSNHLKKPPNTAEAQQALYAAAAAASSFPPNPFASATPGNAAAMFPPMIDMSSTQALLNMVRTANAHNASQLETYLKGAIKRPPPSESTPLDLSSGAVPAYSKKARTNKNLSVSDSMFLKSDSILNIPMMDALRTTKERLGKRLGSVSPKPPSRSLANNGGNSAGSSPRLVPPSTVTSQHAFGRNVPCMSLCSTGERPCPDSQSVAHWTVDDVCNFVASIDICAEYVQAFREQRIDGWALPLLTEAHLTGALGLRLGPALKLRATVARRLGHCANCMHCAHCHTPPPSPTALP